MTTPRTILLIALTALLSVAVAGVIGAGVLGSGEALAHGSGHLGFGGQGFGGQGFGGHHRRGGDPCERLTSHSMRIAEVVIETHLDLEAPQMATLQPLLSVVDEWRHDLAEVCDAGQRVENVPQALGALETALDRSARAVRDLRPAYDAFYGSLTDEQRLHIDEAIEKHRQRHNHQSEEG